MNIFNRLIKLYNKNENSTKLPLEDYTTEILVGILENNKEKLDLFVNKVLKIRGHNFNIKSQKKYYLNNDSDCIIDIIIENDEIICFLENKVNSFEGNRQLERYKNVLHNLKKKYNKEVYLRYCTKYYDKKEIDGIDFYQFRWKNIYNFFCREKRDRIIDSYLEFLRGEGMGSEGEFNFDDLVVLSKMNSTLLKVRECLEDIKYIFEMNFGKSKESTNQYGIWRYKLCPFIEGHKYDEIYIGVRFVEIKGSIVPYLNCGFCFCSKLENRNSMIRKMNELISFDFVSENEDFIDGEFRKPFSDILSSENHFEEIEKWYIEKIKKLKEFINETPYLNWNLE
ncbi:MAG: PD-(D/E)XK nuclease family protein [Peptostreptococcaceae bacterium]|jgi:hypothetical protein|nr:PD-(D/E)XK nuclease family protein [Peptostreptococcaceae bacterium]